LHERDSFSPQGLTFAEPESSSTFDLAERKHSDHLQSYASRYFSKLKQSGTKNKRRNKYAMTSDVM